MNAILRIAILFAIVFLPGKTFGQDIGDTFRAKMYFCYSPVDLVEAAQGAANGIVQQKLIEEKCKSDFADFTVKRTVEDFELPNGAKLFVIEMEADYKGRWHTVYVVSSSPPHKDKLYIEVTWKPEYSKVPQPVIDWFKAQLVKGGAKGHAYQRLGIVECCEHAERLRTKFVAIPGQEWMYYPDPNCITKGCMLLPIPDDVTHEEEIHALKPEDDNLPEFIEMRKEGVIMIYNGQPSCFWPPTESGG